MTIKLWAGLQKFCGAESVQVNGRAETGERAAGTNWWEGPEQLIASQGRQLGWQQEQSAFCHFEIFCCGVIAKEDGLPCDFWIDICRSDLDKKKTVTKNKIRVKSVDLQFWS